MYDIITIGTATRDIFIKSPFFKQVHDPQHLKKLGFATGDANCIAIGAKIGVEKPILTTGGGATNAATTFARMNLKTATVIKLGDDDEAVHILDELKHERIKPFAITDTKHETGYSVILLSPDGERTILTYRGASETILPKELPPMKDLQAKWVYIVPSGIGFSTLKRIIDHFAANGTKIAMNPSMHLINMGLSKIRPLLKKTNVLIVNREEACALAKVPFAEKHAILKVLDQTVGGVLVMTDGPNGATVSDGTTRYEIGVFKKKLVDRTGAGDAFGSAFVAGAMFMGETCKRGDTDPGSIQYAMRLASANSASVIEHIGAKRGILSVEAFRGNPRWKHLPVRITRIHP